MEIGDALVQIADKLGITVQQVYELFVRVQTVRGILTIISIFIFIIGTYFYLSWIDKKYQQKKKMLKNSNAWMMDYDDNLIIYVIKAIVGTAIFLGIVLLIGDAILQIMYPEYYGAKELIETLSRFRR